MDPYNGSSSSIIQEKCLHYPLAILRMFEISQEGENTVPIVICVLAIPASLVTTVANILVMISIWRTPSLHSPSNNLLVGLACSDLGVGLVTLPASILENFAMIRQDMLLFCTSLRVAIATGKNFCTVSVLTLTAISMDRYIAIHYHLRYQEIVTLKRSFMTLALICLLAGLCTLFFLSMVHYGFYFYLSLNIICVCVVVFASGSIYRVVRRHQRVIALQRAVRARSPETRPISLLRFKRSFVNMQILCWALLVFYLPFFILAGHMVLPRGTLQLGQSFRQFAVFSLYLNSTVNPFLYCWRYRHIRVALRKLAHDVSCKESPMTN